MNSGPGSVSYLIQAANAGGLASESGESRRRQDAKDQKSGAGRNSISVSEEVALCLAAMAWQASGLVCTLHDGHMMKSSRQLFMFGPTWPQLLLLLLMLLCKGSPRFQAADAHHLRGALAVLRRPR